VSFEATTVSGFFYFWREYTATVSGSVRRRVRCVGCSHEYGYDVWRVAAGGGHSPFHLTNATAKLAAKERAHSNLVRTLDEAIEPVFCPVCGIYQPDMVHLLKNRLGPKCEPNKWASLRATIPWETAWREVRAADTIELYERFVEMWPSHGVLAEKRIRELKHPVLRRALSGIFWIVWGSVVMIALTLSLLFAIGPYLGWK
jgi:hypothetical protein